MSRRREQVGSRCLFRRLLPRRIPQSRGVRLSRVEDGHGSTSRAVGASITTSELRSSATAAATGVSIASILSLVVGAVSNTPPHALQNRFDRWFSKPHSGQTLSRPTNPAWGLPGIAPTGAPHCEQNFLPRLIADPHRGQGRARVAPAVGRGCSAFKAKPAPNGCDGEGLPESATISTAASQSPSLSCAPSRTRSSSRETAKISSLLGEEPACWTPGLLRDQITWDR